MLFFKNLVVNDKRIRFIKFMITGAINTLFGYLVFAVLLFIGMHYAVASLLSTIIGILFNFKTIGTLVFENRNNGLLGKFILVYVFIYMFNVTLLTLMSGYCEVYVAGFFLMIPSAMISFFLNNKFVFGNNNDLEGRRRADEEN